jgi:excisionase family DNA binding protein
MAMAKPEGDILTLDEVAAYLQAGKRTVYRLAASSQILAFKFGATWRFRRSELDHWIAACMNEAQGAMMKQPRCSVVISASPERQCAALPRKPQQLKKR